MFLENKNVMFDLLIHLFLQPRRLNIKIIYDGHYTEGYR